MAQHSSVIGKITEELGELGKKVVTETAKAPVDIAAGVFEKDTSKKTQQTSPQADVSEQAAQKPTKTPLEKFDEATDEKEKRTLARPALEYLQSKDRKTSEASVYEKKMQEEGEKKEKVKRQQAAALWQQLPHTGSAPRKGDLRNIAKKQAGTETKVNIVNQ